MVIPRYFPIDLFVQRLTDRDADHGFAVGKFPVDFFRVPQHVFPLSVYILAVPQMPCSGNDGAAVFKGEPVGLLGIINRTLGNHMTGLALLIEHKVSNFQLTHGGKAIRCGNRRIQRQLFPVLLRDFDISRAKLTLSVRIHHTEDVTDDLLLPWKQPEPFPSPLALCVFEHLNEAHCLVRFLFVVMRRREHEPRRLVILQLRYALRSLFLFFHSHHSSSNSSISSRSELSFPATSLLLAAGVSPSSCAYLCMSTEYF